MNNKKVYNKLFVMALVSSFGVMYPKDASSDNFTGLADLNLPFASDEDKYNQSNLDTLNELPFSTQNEDEMKDILRDYQELQKSSDIDDKEGEMSVKDYFLTLSGEYEDMAKVLNFYGDILKSDSVQLIENAQEYKSNFEELNEFFDDLKKNYSETFEKLMKNEKYAALVSWIKSEVESVSMVTTYDHNDTTKV